MQMMRIPTVWTVNLVALLFGMGMYSMFAFLPQFLQTPELTGYGFGVSVTESGLLLLPQTAATFVAGVFSGRLAARYGSKAVLVAGATLTALGTLGLTVVATGAVADRHRDRGARPRLRPGLRRDVQPRRRGRPSDADRRGQRHERQHPHGRRCDSAAPSSPAWSPQAPGRTGSRPKSGYTHGFGLLVVTSTLAALVAVFVPVVRAAAHLVPGPQAEAEAEERPGRRPASQLAGPAASRGVTPFVYGRSLLGSSVTKGVGDAVEVHGCGWWPFVARRGRSWRRRCPRT